MLPKKKGFTLIEMVVVTAVFAIVIMLTFMIWENLTLNYKHQEQLVNAQNRARIGVATIINRLKQADDRTSYTVSIYTYSSDSIVPSGSAVNSIEINNVEINNTDNSKEYNSFIYKTVDSVSFPGTKSLMVYIGSDTLDQTTAFARAQNDPSPQIVCDGLKSTDGFMISKDADNKINVSVQACILNNKLPSLTEQPVSMYGNYTFRANDVKIDTALIANNNDM